MPQLVECSLSRQKEGPRFSSQHHVSQIWEYMAVISALGRWRQESQLFKAILGGHIVSSRLS